MKRRDRKRFAVHLIAAALCTALALLAGCGQVGGTAADAVSTPKQDSSAAQSVQQARTAGIMQPILPFPIGEGAGINTGDAFYEMIRLGVDDDWRTLLLKTDYATGKQSCLCQKQGCAHNDESCNAFLKNGVRVKIMIANNALYLLYESAPRAVLSSAEQMQRDADNAWCSYIDVISLDGAQKKRVTELSNTICAAFRCADNAVAYGSYYTLEDKALEQEGLWVDLKTGEYGTYPLENTFDIGQYKNMVVAETFASDQDLSSLTGEALAAAYQSGKKEYYGIQPFGGERRLLASVPYSSMSILLARERIYYIKLSSDSQSASFAYSDLNTGEETVVLQDAIHIAVDPLNTQMMLPDKDGTPRYVKCSDGSRPGYNTALLDVDTGEVIPTLLERGPFDRDKNTVTPVAQANDGRWLVVTDRMENPTGDTVQTRGRYALISPEDFFAGKENYQEVTMYEQV